MRTAERHRAHRRDAVVDHRRRRSHRHRLRRARAGAAARTTTASLSPVRYDTTSVTAITSRKTRNSSGLRYPPLNATARATTRPSTSTVHDTNAYDRSGAFVGRARPRRRGRGTRARHRRLTDWRCRPPRAPATARRPRAPGSTGARAAGRRPATLRPGSTTSSSAPGASSEVRHSLVVTDRQLRIVTVESSGGDRAAAAPRASSATMTTDRPAGCHCMQYPAGPRGRRLRERADRAHPGSSGVGSGGQRDRSETPRGRHSRVPGRPPRRRGQRRPARRTTSSGARRASGGTGVPTMGTTDHGGVTAAGRAEPAARRPRCRLASPRRRRRRWHQSRGGVGVPSSGGGPCVAIRRVGTAAAVSGSRAVSIAGGRAPLRRSPAAAVPGPAAGDPCRHRHVRRRRSMADGRRGADSGRPPQPRPRPATPRRVGGQRSRRSGPSGSPRDAVLAWVSTLGAQRTGSGTVHSRQAYDYLE